MPHHKLPIDVIYLSLLSKLGARVSSCSFALFP